MSSRRKFSEELLMSRRILMSPSAAPISLLSSSFTQNTCPSLQSLSSSIHHHFYRHLCRHEMSARCVHKIANILNKQTIITLTGTKSIPTEKQQQTFINKKSKQKFTVESSLVQYRRLATNQKTYDILSYYYNSSKQPTCDITTKLKPIVSCLHSCATYPLFSLPSSPVMFAKLFTRFMSTIQMKNSTSSGQPIESEFENLRSHPKGHKRIKINACAKLYRELSVTKPSLFGGAPKDCGINFELAYYDSWDLLDPAKRDGAPIVCLLHGAPGSYTDFDSLIHHLSSRGVRVLAPSFPTYSATYEHSFRHSPRERLDYLLEFFRALRVTNIDMLIGFSSSVYTVFELLNQSFSHESNVENTHSSVKIRSLGLFSTPTYNLPRNLAVTPFRLFTLKLFDYPLLRPIIITLIQTFVKLQGIQNKVEPSKIENLLIAASAVGYSDSEKVADRLKLIHKFQVPTFVLFGCNDKLIPMRCFNQLMQDLGVEEDSQVRHYGEQGELIRDANVDARNKLVQVSQFETGGHYTFMKYSRQVNEDVYGFLATKVMKQQQQIVESTKL